MANPKIEVRTDFQAIETRSNEDGTLRFEGYVAVFNHESAPLEDGMGMFTEIIRPGCFARTLKQMPDVVCLKNHNSDFPLGRVGSGNLKLFEDEVGLRYELDAPPLSYAKDLAILVEGKIAHQCSFGFICELDEVAFVGDRIIRTLVDVTLLEASLGVPFPAYGGTSSVVVRSDVVRRAMPVALKTSSPRLARLKRQVEVLRLGSPV